MKNNSLINKKIEGKRLLKSNIDKNNKKDKHKENIESKKLNRGEG